MKIKVTIMKIGFFLILCLSIGGATASLAQSIPAGLGTTPPPQCATMEQDSINRLRYPGRPTLDDFEDAIRIRVNEIIARNKAGRTQATVVTIPIIVHVVNNGEAIGTGLNISQAQVQAQIDVLNEDYRKKVGTPGGSSTNPVAADIEIEFCLSPVDENGKPMAEPGIDRYNGGKTSWTKEDIEASLKSTTIWNPNLFYNVWTVKFGGTSANLLGYAQFPDQSGLSGLNETGGPASTDGVVVQYSSFGSADKGNFPVMQAPYNKGRTLSHETGHWLGLRHIWGDGDCADDFVSDTPTQQSSSSGCPVGRFTCGTTNMIENYMDYTNDACMNIFTLGQKARMQAVMQLSPRRTSLLAANLCSPAVAAAPKTNFSTDNLTCVLLGSEVNFTDLSSNFPTEWHWTFEGGDPGTSTDRNPKVHYNTPGNFKVSLWSKNSIGPSDTLTLVDYIIVSSQGLCLNFNNFLPAYTPSTLPLSQFGTYTGYLTGHNSLKSSGVSEFFANACGYNFVSGVKIRFAHAYSTAEDATVTVILWNARGPQHAPGSVIERKVVLLKQIQEDLANNQPTTIVFDRESPVLSKPFQVGVELTYTTGDSVAIQSSANGEATNASSWIRNNAGTWQPYTIALGANIAMNIEPIVGMDPSVQVSASKLLVYPGEEVVLNGHGASIFVWSAEDGSVQNVAGPQLIAHPSVTTTFMTIGSGLKLCNDTTYTTIYVRQNVTGLEPDPLVAGISLFPNPGTGQLNVVVENTLRSAVTIRLYSILGIEVTDPVFAQKSGDRLISTLDASTLRPGIYLVTIKLGERSVVRKWVKY
jgi:PKD repeat protein